MFKNNLRVYLARAMSGRSKEEVVKEARNDRMKLLKKGIYPLCPVLAENVKVGKGVILATKDQMDNYWFRDKQMIREANVVFDMTPHLKSEGVAHEIGYARYSLWKPIVRVFPKGMLPNSGNVRFYEDDVVVDDLSAACAMVQHKWGTIYKRVFWRISLLVRCLPKWIFYQFKEFK